MCRQTLLFILMVCVLRYAVSSGVFRVKSYLLPSLASPHSRSVTTMAARDAFYMLPDSLVAFILSKIPIKEAVRSSILSKRWRFLYTKILKLCISPESVLGADVLEAHKGDISHMMAVSESIISDILLLHSCDLEGFYLYSTRETENFHFSPEKVCKWVRYASLSNVKYLSLFEDSISGELAPSALFSCSTLITLVLNGYVLTNFPINSVGFPHLISCHLYAVQLPEESLVSLISLCPLLQELVISHEFFGGEYYGPQHGNFTIFSSTIEYLRMDGAKSLSLECPNLIQFEGCEIEDLSVNGVRFYELSNAITSLRMHSECTLMELSLYLGRGLELISANRLHHIVGNFQSLEELYIHMFGPFEREEKRDVPLLNLLYKLPNLQSLTIAGYFPKELARDPIPSCIASPHVNLRKIRVEPDEFGSEKDEVAVINYLLQITPCLEIMEIQLPRTYDFPQEKYEIQYMDCRDILYLRRASSRARIIVMTS